MLAHLLLAGEPFDLLRDKLCTSRGEKLHIQQKPPGEHTAFQMIQQTALLFHGCIILDFKFPSMKKIYRHVRSLRSRVVRISVSFCTLYFRTDIYCDYGRTLASLQTWRPRCHHTPSCWRNLAAVSAVSHSLLTAVIQIWVSSRWSPGNSWLNYPGSKSDSSGWWAQTCVCECWWKKSVHALFSLLFCGLVQNKLDFPSHVHPQSRAKTGITLSPG